MSVRTMMVVAALAGAFGTAHAADSPLGVWLDDSGRGAVEITECGGGKLCGKLVWLKDDKDAKACGTAIIGDVTKEGDGWDNGWIYSPEKDSKYDVALTPAGTDKLTVLGYAGTKLFSREMTWTRAPADLKRCDLQEAKATVAPGPNVKRNDSPAAAGSSSEQRTQTADASAAVSSGEAGKAEPAAKPKKKIFSRRKDMCRVEAPFVTVDFPCDDD